MHRKIHESKTIPQKTSPQYFAFSSKLFVHEYCRRSIPTFQKKLFQYKSKKTLLQIYQQHISKTNSWYELTRINIKITLKKKRGTFTFNKIYI